MGGGSIEKGREARFGSGGGALGAKALEEKGRALQKKERRALVVQVTRKGGRGKPRAKRGRVITTSLEKKQGPERASKKAGKKRKGCDTKMGRKNALERQGGK